MSLWLDTRGKSSVAIGICDRCHRKVSITELSPDRDKPGVRVCRDPGCNDEKDPYRLPARRPDKISVEYPRPDVEISSS